MRIRSSIVVAAKLIAVCTLATACGGGGAGKIMADTTILPYQAPDIDEITGIDSDSDPDSDSAGSGAGSAQNPQK